MTKDAAATRLLDNARRALARSIAGKSSDKTDSSVRYTTATGTNQIFGRTYPAIQSVFDGQWCAYHREGGDWVILGPVGGTSSAVLAGFTAVAGWSVAVSPRREGAKLFIHAVIERTGGAVAPTNVNQTIGTLTNPAAIGNGPVQGLPIFEVAAGALFRAGFSYDPATGDLALMATSDTIPTGAIFTVSASVLVAVP